MKNSIIIILIFVIFSCSSTTHEENLAIHVEQIQIPIDENFLNTYQIWDPYYKNEEAKLLAYNEKRHSFDLFSLDKLIICEYILCISSESFRCKSGF